MWSPDPFLSWPVCAGSSSRPFTTVLLSPCRRRAVRHRLDRGPRPVLTEPPQPGPDARLDRPDRHTVALADLVRGAATEDGEHHRPSLVRWERADPGHGTIGFHRRDRRLAGGVLHHAT